MYAVIETGGKQYRVELGTEIEVNHLDVEPGQTLELERVLLVADGDNASIGRPTVEGALVSARVVRQDRGEKLIVFKYRPKARTRVKHGHRQDLTVLRIADIRLDGRSAADEARAADAERRAAEEAAAEEAARRAAADQALAAKLAAEADSEAPTDAGATSAKRPTARSAAKAPAKPAGATTTKRPASTTSRTQAGESKAAKATKTTKATTPAPTTDPTKDE